MKHYGVAILLAVLCLTTACPQAGQVLSPATFSASNDKGEDRDAGASDTLAEAPEISPIAPKSDPADVDKPEKISAPLPGYAPNLDNALKSNDLAQLPDMSAKQAPGLGGPIEPKSDSGNVTINSIQEFRIRYGANFDQVLPPSPPLPFLTKAGGGSLTLSYILEMGMPSYGVAWSLPTPNAEGLAYPLRLVFTPTGKAESYYCDATWVDPATNGGANVVFKNLALGAGTISLHLIETIQVDAEGNLIYEKPSDLHTDGLVPLNVAYPWIPFPPGNIPSKVHKLGSFTVVPMVFKQIILQP